MREKSKGWKSRRRRIRGSGIKKEGRVTRSRELDPINDLLALLYRRDSKHCLAAAAAAAVEARVCLRQYHETQQQLLSCPVAVFTASSYLLTYLLTFFISRFVDFHDFSDDSMGKRTRLRKISFGYGNPAPGFYY